jgi:hypothetical protein
VENFLNQIPKPLLALIAVVGMAFFIYYAQPPRTICDTERETFEESLKGELYPERVSKKQGLRPAEMTKAKEYCKLGNSSGGCLEYFNLLRNIVRSMDLLSQECLPVLAEAPQVHSALKEGLSLMVLLAWGDQPPIDQNQNWFRYADYAVFCKVREQLKKITPEDELNEFYLAILGQLPGPKPTDSFSPRSKAIQTMPQSEVFQKSILSLRCGSYI